MYVHRGFHGPMRINLDLNKKRHDIVGPDVLFLNGSYNAHFPEVEIIL